MSFDASFLDEIRARVSIAAAVGRKVKLTRRGREHLGLCPFHNEKTPSFTVSEDKAFFHCFGCGAHGDVIGFVMQSEGLSFPEAVERLAGEAGLQVPRASPEARETQRRQSGVLEVLEAAAEWFAAQLAGREGAEARGYLTRRGLTEDTIAAFRLGYAPGRRGLLRAALNARGIGDAQLAEAGLIKRREEGAGEGPGDDGTPRDYFFNRIVFPISDRRGQVIAFGGRALGESPAKYLNSPDTPVFHKGRVLYNLARARRAAHDGAEVIVAEGYMDVIALAQAGFGAAVAPLGTAITEGQIAELWRLAEEPVLCLDGDVAGRRAAFRAAERALPGLRPGYSLRFAFLPEGEDPDSLLRSGGAEALRTLLAAARPLSDVLWSMETEGHRFETPERRAGLMRALDGRIRAIADADVQRAYREAFDRRFLETFGYGPWSGGRRAPAGGPGRFAAGGWGRERRGRHLAAGAALGRGRPAGVPRAAPGVLGGRQAPGLLLRRQEQVLLACLVNHPGLIAEHAEELAELELANPSFPGFCGVLLDLAARDPDLDTAGLKCHLSEQGFSAILAEILCPDVLVHGRFARPGGGVEEARTGVQDVLRTYRKQRVAMETEEAVRILAESPTEDNLVRLEAKKRLLHDEEETGDRADAVVPEET